MRIDAFDRKVIRFVLLWKPFGGPPADEVFPQFGLKPAQLTRRFHRIVTKMASAESELSEQDHELLAQVRRVFPDPTHQVSADGNFSAVHERA